MNSIYKFLPQKLRLPEISLLSLAIFILLPQTSYAIGSNFDYYTKVKFEYQYSDYLEYSWPEFVEYSFGDHDFSQPNPLLASFPEHRGLTRVTQGFGADLEVVMMYQYSYNGFTYDYDQLGNLSKSQSDEGIYNARAEYKMQDNFTVNSAAQYTKTSSGLKGWMGVWGCEYDFGGFFKIEPDISLFWNDVAGIKSNAQAYNLKLRQALTNTTATQIKYAYFRTDPVADQEGLTYQTITWWVSQWLPTETAVHLFLRYHFDNLDGQSIGPGIEISQYIDFATILTLSYRNFKMVNDDPASAFNEAVGKGAFYSNAFTILVKRTIFGDTEASIKYRYYTTNQNTRMNTYLFSIEHVF